MLGFGVAGFGRQLSGQAPEGSKERQESQEEVGSGRKDLRGAAQDAARDFGVIRAGLVLSFVAFGVHWVQRLRSCPLLSWSTTPRSLCVCGCCSHGFDVHVTSVCLDSAACGRNGSTVVRPNPVRCVGGHSEALRAVLALPARSSRPRWQAWQHVDTIATIRHGTVQVVGAWHHPATAQAQRLACRPCTATAPSQPRAPLQPTQAALYSKEHRRVSLYVREGTSGRELVEGSCHQVTTASWHSGKGKTKLAGKEGRDGLGVDRNDHDAMTRAKPCGWISSCLPGVVDAAHRLKHPSRATKAECVVSHGSIDITTGAAWTVPSR